MCKNSITKSTYFGYLDPFIKNTIEQNLSPEIERILTGLNQFKRCLKEEMVADLRYFNSLEFEVESLRSQLETQKTQFSNEIDRLSREYYYVDNMNAILGVYTELDEDLKAQLQDKGIVISELKKLIEKLKGKSVDTKFKKSSVIQQPDAFKRVIPKTSVSRPRLKSNLQGDRVLRSNSRGKNLEVEEHRRNVKLPKNKTSVTACNDSLNAKTLNVKFVSTICAKCVMIDKHDLCLLKSVAKPLKKTVASESNKKPINN
nr:hypothetical protein [Tanacetum cinerariifolium]